MNPVAIFRQYDLVLWALAVYLCSLAFNFTRDVPLALLAAVSLYAFSTREHPFPRERLVAMWPVLVFLLASVLVTLVSEDVRQSLRVQVQLLPALLIYAAVVLGVEKREQQRFVVIALVFAALVAELVLMARILPMWDVPDRLEKMRIIRNPLIYAPNDVLFFAVWAPLAAYLLFDASRAIKRLGGLYLALTFVVLIYMQSRQAIAVYLLSLGVMALLWRPAWGLAVLVGGGALVLLFDWLSGRGLIDKLVYLFPRRYIWAAAWQMFLDQPWFGHGPGMFKAHYVEYLEKAGYALSQVEDRRPMNWAHSLYLEQLAERGLTGLLALLTVIAGAVIALWRAFFKKKSWYINALLGCWVGFAVAGIAESSLVRLWVVSTLLLLSGLSHLQVRGGVES